jgi:hypothetical protein
MSPCVTGFNPAVTRINVTAIDGELDHSLH